MKPSLHLIATDKLDYAFVQWSTKLYSMSFWCRKMKRESRGNQDVCATNLGCLLGWDILNVKVLLISLDSFCYLHMLVKQKNIIQIIGYGYGRVKPIACLIGEGDVGVIYDCHRSNQTSPFWRCFPLLCHPGCSVHVGIFLSIWLLSVSFRPWNSLRAIVHALSVTPNVWMDCLSNQNR